MPKILPIFFGIFFLTACAEKVSYSPQSWSDLPEFNSLQSSNIRQSLLPTCEKYAKKPPQKFIHNNKLFGTYGDWVAICSELKNISNNKNDKAVYTSAVGGNIANNDATNNSDVNPINSLEFLQKYFTPYKISSPKGSLFTGYYTPILEGRLQQGGEYQTPLYGLPNNLFTADLGDFYPELKGKKITTRISGKKLKPYFTRGEISLGKISANPKAKATPNEQFISGEPIIWLKNSTDAFFLHIQGSGLIKLPNGKLQQVAYGGSNGHKYVSIGKVLLEAGELQREEISLQTIRRWLEENPQKRERLFNKNPRYIFFRLDNKPTTGSFQTELIAKQSLAVDPKYIPLGTPLYVTTNLTANGKNHNKMMFAHDTGAAIKGAVRGDIYFGVGAKAEHLAGMQNSRGELFVLLPRIGN